MSMSRLALIKSVNKYVKSALLSIEFGQFRRFSQNPSRMTEKMDSLLKQLAPPLTEDKHKGQAGRIGVFGGSLEYTGAPYFAAMASLKVGADLSHVFCTEAAAPVIKSYSPELIVHPLLDAPQATQKIEPWLDRFHAILIGPGLGREEKTFKVIDEVISLCRLRKKPLVIDADGLYYISIKPDVLRDYPSPVILTPNIMEFARLIGSNGERSKKEQSDNFLSVSPNITILCKGRRDEIFNGKATAEVEGGGSARRCGGQGDLLSGVVTTFLAWAVEMKGLEEMERPVLAAYAGCRLARSCNGRAFAKFGRSMTCSDMIKEIHEAFEELFQCK